MPVAPHVAKARQDRYDRRMAEAEKVVPTGPYCYRVISPPRVSPNDGGLLPGKSEVCPHWKLRKDKPRQQNGFCRLLKAGDWMSKPHGTTLLWDGCKECGINFDDDDTPSCEVT